MTISAKILADSVSLYGDRITTMELRYPRLIHSELMTHRMFSRNASSSRAVPVERLIQDVLDDPAMPVSWGKNQRGMQDAGEHSAPVEVLLPSDGDGVHSWLETDPCGNYSWETSYDPAQTWLVARDFAVAMARSYANAGYHKQICNRLLEPFSHINVVVTATEWDNFYKLRLHPDADPTMRVLAEHMWAAQFSSEPELLGTGQWHLPYVNRGDSCAKFVSTARCARVSYKTFDGRPSEIDDDMQLYEDLEDGGHWSPFEHQATPRGGRHANLNGWMSHRTEMGQ